MADFTFRPIDVWPGELTARHARQHSPFTALWGDTMLMLGRELDVLDARLVVIQLALTEPDLRRDGLPRTNTRPAHPGVIVAFESRHGPMKFATDRYVRTPWRRAGASEDWQHNVRAITLGLEALRKVDRYGITRRGEQYRGWNALGPGTALPATHMTADDAARFIAAHGGPWSEVGPDEQMLADFTAGMLREGLVDNVFRLAARRLHPDAGGDPALFARLTDARDLLARSQP
ncbi:MAG TPA: hypothetical protein VGA69_04055 [Nitriliruptorales bacterium]